MKFVLRNFCKAFVSALSCVYSIDKNRGTVILELAFTCRFHLYEGGPSMQDFTNSHNRSLLLHGVLMIAVGTSACALASTMTKPDCQKIGYLLASSLIAGYLLVIAVYLGLRKLPPVPRTVAMPHMAAVVGLTCFAVYSTLASGPADIHIVWLLAAFIGLFWAAWDVTLAVRFSSRRLQGLGFASIAAANSALSVMLVTGPSSNPVSAVSASGAFLIVVGVQVYISSALLHRELRHDSSPQMS